MAYVTPIGSNPEQIEYRLGGGHGCRPVEQDRQFDYHADGRERPLRWIGEGLAEVGIESGSVLDPGQFDTARALLQGTDPRTGEQLVKHKLAVPNDAKVELAPLVAAVREKARAEGVAGEVLMDSDRSRSMFSRAERQVETKGEAARLRADDAGTIAAAAGLDPDEVWGSGVHSAAVSNLTMTQVVSDGAGGTIETVVPRRIVAGNLGYDVSFTLPKSYSLLLAFADEDTASKVEDLYASQVGETFGWLESETAYGMRGHHGDGKSAEVVSGSGFLGWAMTHRSARPVEGRVVGDPHWHVHVTIANMTRGTDGKWSTVAAGGRDLMRHAPAVDHVLKALVRRQLAQTYGVQFERNERTGAWEVAAIPDAVLRAFSKRGAAIESLLRDLGFDPERASAQADRIAAAQSREGKGEATAAPDVTLRDLWQREARGLGVDLAGLIEEALAGAPSVELVDQVDVDQIVSQITDPDHGLTSERRRFTRIDVMAAVADALQIGAVDVEQIEALTDRVMRDPRFVDLDPDTPQRGSSGRMTNLGAKHMANAKLMSTRDVVDVEIYILDAARDAGETPIAIRPEAARMSQSATELAQGYDLSEEQARALMQLVCSGRSIDALIGGPGAGKTTLMRAARSAWQAEGFVVAGAATAAVAAQNLQRESGIESLTVAQWLLAVETARAEGTESPLREVDVLVLDEANLTDDRARYGLYVAAASAGTKIVEVGDPRQLRGVGCGSLFGEVHRLTNGPQLLDNRRQIEEDERSILAAWREDRFGDALARWEAKGRVVATETGDEAIAAMVSTWLEQRRGAPNPHAQQRGLLMLGSTNEQVDRINAATQAVRREEGELGRARRYQVRAGHDLTLHAGDHVIARLNDRSGRLHTGGPGVLNGFRGVVDKIDRQGNVHFSWEQDDQDGRTHHTAKLSPEYVARGGVELAYAITVHKAEGLTVSGQWERPDGTQQRGSVLVSASGSDEAGIYVAMSRHKDHAVLFAAREQVETDQQTYLEGQPNDAQERARRVVAALAEQARQTRDDPNDVPVVRDLGREDEPRDRPEPPEPAPRDDAKREEERRRRWRDRGRADRGRGRGGRDR